MFLLMHGEDEGVQDAAVSSELCAKTFRAKRS
jgi:hypothetical protein